MFPLSNCVALAAALCRPKNKQNKHCIERAVVRARHATSSPLRPYSLALRAVPRATSVLRFTFASIKNLFVNGKHVENLFVLCGHLSRDTFPCAGLCDFVPPCGYGHPKPLMIAAPPKKPSFKEQVDVLITAGHDCLKSTNSMSDLMDRFGRFATTGPFTLADPPSSTGFPSSPCDRPTFGSQHLSPISQC